MRAVVQRVRQAEVRVKECRVSRIASGLLVLLGVAGDDAPRDADFLAAKTANLRIFEDAAGRLNLSLLETGGEMLVVSQFTLLGDCRKGRRPSFAGAAPPEKGEALYRHFIGAVAAQGVRVAEGRFGAHMEVALVNAGPVTLVIDSR